MTKTTTETKIITTPTGSPEEPVYQMNTTPAGEKFLQQIKTRNVYEEIQSHEDECRIENLVSNIINGDPTGLMPDIDPANLVADFSEAPMSFAEAMTQLANIRSEYELLPVEFKEKFDFNPQNYLNEYASESWANKMNLGGETNELRTDDQNVNTSENQHPAKQIQNAENA